jgi:hypothetical protein
MELNCAAGRRLNPTITLSINGEILLTPELAFKSDNSNPTSFRLKWRSKRTAGEGYHFFRHLSEKMTTQNASEA